MPTRAPRHAYKEVRLQQLRSFCETARLGSLTAAAAALGLAQPTVCEQVHALERAFADKLIERHAHGCRLTDTGRLVAELAAPLVAGMQSLNRNVQEARRRAESRLTVASTQRILVEDLPASIVAFERKHPDVRLRFLERMTGDVAAAVDSGEADLGVTIQPDADPRDPRLAFEPAYELDVILVTPKEHPLSKRRRVVPRDLLGFPLVNAPDGIPDPVITAQLEKLGIFRDQPRRVEAYHTTVIRRFVEIGFGIGLVVGLPSHKPPAHLHERSLSPHFGRLTVHLVRRKGALSSGAARDFADTVKSCLNRGRKSGLIRQSGD